MSSEARKDMEPFDEAYQAVDWKRFESLPLFRAAVSGGQPRERVQHLSFDGMRIAMTGAVLPVPLALSDALINALERANPLFEMVSLEGCPFCRVARDSYLAPLNREGVVSVYQIDMRSTQAVRALIRTTP